MGDSAQTLPSQPRSLFPTPTNLPEEPRALVRLCCEPEANGGFQDPSKQGNRDKAKMQEKVQSEPRDGRPWEDCTVDRNPPRLRSVGPAAGAPRHAPPPTGPSLGLCRRPPLPPLTGASWARVFPTTPHPHPLFCPSPPVPPEGGHRLGGSYPLQQTCLGPWPALSSPHVILRKAQDVIESRSPKSRGRNTAVRRTTPT